MKVVAISGSPKPPSESTTEKFLNLFLEGLGDAATSLERFYPAHMHINYCSGCHCCWFNTPEQCQHNDDFQQIRSALTDMDLFILATPLHADGMTAPAKNVLDRMLATMPPFMYVDREGRTRHHKDEPNKPKAILISGCGFPEPSNFAPLIVHFQAACQNLGLEYGGHITIAAAPAANYMPSFAERANLIREAGRAFAEQGIIPEPIMEQMNGPWIDADEYRENSNTQFESILKTPMP
ncbi:MAG: flavodoxin family protein [Firmicutes bacterium]|nr:flavodoxin family protein [Bacillota bacterium]